MLIYVSMIFYPIRHYEVGFFFQLLADHALSDGQLIMRL